VPLSVEFWITLRRYCKGAPFYNASYLRVGIDLGLSKETGRTENAPSVAQVRDSILSVIGTAKVEDLLTAKGKIQLKDDLLKALQQRMPELGVEEIYFTEFLIQR
jgi:flagellar FliL protein